MTRAELRLELLRIAHHPAQSDKLSVEIARRWEGEYFSDLTFEAGVAEGEKKSPAKPKAP